MFIITEKGRVKDLFIDCAEEVVSLLEVELQKPRNLSAHESEECEHGEGVGVYVMMWYVHERSTGIFDTQPPSRSCRNASTPDHGLS